MGRKEKGDDVRRWERQRTTAEQGGGREGRRKQEKGEMKEEKKGRKQWTRIEKARRRRRKEMMRWWDESDKQQQQNKEKKQRLEQEQERRKKAREEKREGEEEKREERINLILCFFEVVLSAHSKPESFFHLILPVESSVIFARCSRSCWPFLIHQECEQERPAAELMINEEGRSRQTASRRQKQKERKKPQNPENKATNKTWTKEKQRQWNNIQIRASSLLPVSWWLWQLLVTISNFTACHISRFVRFSRFGLIFFI